MVDRRILNHGVCIAAVLSLLVAVMASPLQPQDSGAAASRHPSLGRNYATPASLSGHRAHKSNPPRAASVKAVQLDGDDEESLIQAAPLTRLSRGPLPSRPLKSMARASRRLGAVSTSRPLRC